MRDGLDVVVAARLLADARLGGRPVRPLPDEARPRDEDEAYVVQEALHRELTARGHGAVVGHKIGCTTEVMQEALGLDHPVAGGIFASTVYQGEATLERLRFVRPAVESEIVVTLRRDLPAANAPYDAASVASAVGACRGAFEITDDRYVDRAAVGVPTQVADDYYSCGSVLGPERPGFDPGLLDQIRTSLSVNGQELATGTGAAVLGHPLEALAWLANTLARRGRSLLAGEFVSLGSIVAACSLEPGDEAVVVHEPLGAVRVRCV